MRSRNLVPAFAMWLAISAAWGGEAPAPAPSGEAAPAEAEATAEESEASKEATPGEGGAVETAAPAEEAGYVDRLRDRAINSPPTLR